MRSMTSNPGWIFLWCGYGVGWGIYSVEIATASSLKKLGFGLYRRGCCYRLRRLSRAPRLRLHLSTPKRMGPTKQTSGHSNGPDGLLQRVIPARAKSYKATNTAAHPQHPLHICAPTTSKNHPPAPSPPPYSTPPAAPSRALSSAILASIFLRAARIISSRRLFSSVCLSSLLALHPSDAALASSASALLSLLWRLYRVMRSGCFGRAGCFCAGVLAAGAVGVGGGRGWKVTGGWASSVEVLYYSMSWEHQRLAAPSAARIPRHSGEQKQEKSTRKTHRL